MAKLSLNKVENLSASMAVRALLLEVDAARASVLKRAINDCGYQLLERIRAADELLAAVEHFQPNCLVVGIDLPDSNTLQMLATLNELAPLPVVMFAEKDTPQIIQKVVAAGVSAFVVDDIQPSRLSSIISVAMARFNEQQQLKTQLKETQNKLEERKLLDKAKGLLMKQKGYSEDEAYKNLRKMSMDKGESMGRVAQSIIDVFALLD